MYHNSRVPAALFGLLTVIPVFAQQPKFEIADVHVSPTARTFAQNFGGVLREGLYVNRDATMLNLIVAAYGVSDDNIAGGLAGLLRTFSMWSPKFRPALHLQTPISCCRTFWRSASTL